MPDLSQLSDDDLQKMYETAPAAAPTPAAQPVPDLSSVSDDDLQKMYAAAPAAVPLPAQTSTNAGEAALRGAAQGVSLGFGDEAAAGTKALKDYLMAKAGLSDPLGVDLPTAYKRNVEMIRARNSLAESEHPGAYMAGTAAGTLGTALVPGLNIASAETMPGRVAMAGGLGAATGAGLSTHNPFQNQDELGHFQGDVVQGGLLGMAGQGVLGEALPAIGRAATGALPEALSGLAENAATKAATGGAGNVYKKLSKQGRVQDVGRELLDSGVVGFGDKAADIVPKAAAGKAAAGQTIGDIVTATDQALPNAVDGKQISQNILDYLAKKTGVGNEPLSNELLGYAQTFENKGQMSMADAMNDKASFEYQGGDKARAQALNKVRSIIGDAMEDAASKADQDLGAANAKYGAMASAEKGATEQAARQGANRWGGLIPNMTGLATGAVAYGASHNPAMAALGPVATGVHKIIQTRGSSTLAASADQVAQILRAAPEALGEYAPLLQKAATQGNQSLDLVHYLLSKDPSYVNQVNQAVGASSP